jgi:AcrR family transcriptional regulator
LTISIPIGIITLILDNRSEILNCALDLFANRGYDAVGVQEVSAAARVTKPTLYHYFGSKQGLLKALVEMYHQPFNAGIKQAAAYHGQLPETLANVAGAYFQFAQENPRYVRLALAAHFAPRHSEAHQVVSGWNEQQHQIVEALFERATREYGNMRGRHKMIAANFIGLMNTCIGLWLGGYVELDQALLQSTLRQFQYGIYS